MRHTEHRQWLRLVGRRADVQIWSPDPRRWALSPQYTRPYADGKGLTASEAWIGEALEPLRAAHLQACARCGSRSRSRIPTAILTDTPSLALQGAELHLPRAEH